MVPLNHHEGDRSKRELATALDSQHIDAALFGALTDQPAGLTIDVVRGIEGVAELESDYARLQHASCNTLPFSLYDWHLSWCRHFLRHDSGLRDLPRFHVVRNAEGVCVAIVPLILTERRLGRLRFNSLTLLGADPAITEIRAALVQPGYESQAAQAVHASLQKCRDWDCIQWCGRGGRFSTALGRLRGLEWQPSAPSYILDLPPTWDQFRAGLKRNIRESLRHGYNSLKRSGHGFTLRVAAEPDAVDEALERLFVLHSLRAAMPGTVHHPDRFAAARIREFMLDVCRRLAARGILRVFQLEIAGRVVATRMGFVVGDGLYLYYSGFDPAWSDYGVMTTTVAEALKYAIANGLKTANLSPGTDVSKTRWGPREVPAQTAYEHGARLGSRLATLAYVRARAGDGLQGWLLQRLLPGRRHWD
jgi:CelD/BcsL family acetyltransferase involved in cellulose biosynthesis